MRDLIECIVFVAVFLIFILGIALGFFTYAGNLDCTSYYEVTGRFTRYTTGTCYVMHNGAWYSMDEYKNRLTGKGELK